MLKGGILSSPPLCFGFPSCILTLNLLPLNMSTLTAPAAPPVRENLLLNLACNVFLPGLILDKLSKAERLGPLWALVVAIALPLGYGLWDWSRRRQWNFFSTLGIAGTFASGGLGLGTHWGWWKATALWYAIKEASIPALIGLAIPLSLRTRSPLIRSLLYNDQILNTARIADALKVRNAQSAFDRLLVQSSWLLTASFILSAALNFILALWLLKAEPASEEWNQQLGRMSWMSWPIIVVPSMGMMMWALFRLMNGIQKVTGLKTDDIFNTPTHKS